jgi:outer membrane immunogenic protein
MNKIALATLALLGLTDLSLAADLPMKAPPMIAPPAYNWNGFYVGANVGYGWEHSTIDSFNSVGVLQDIVTGNGNGVFGGFQAGYNWQMSPNWLIGGEADWEGSGISRSTFACTATGCAQSNNHTNDFGTIRGRIGYVWNNILLYGTGGLAFTDISTDRAIVCVVAGGGTCPGGPSPSPLTGMVARATGISTGWAAGGGIEWMILPNWTAKVEYLRLEFHDVGSDFTYPGFATAFRHTNAHDSYDTVKVGVNYLFNVPSPAVVAKY